MLHFFKNTDHTVCGNTEQISRFWPDHRNIVGDVRVGVVEFDGFSFYIAGILILKTHLGGQRKIGVRDVAAGSHEVTVEVEKCLNPMENRALQATNYA